MLCDFYNHKMQYQENFLAKYYIKHGHEVTIIASTFESIFDYMSDKYDSTIEKNICIVDKVKIIKLPYSLNVLNRLRKFDDVRAILESERPDIIFSHGIHLNLSDAVQYKKKNSGCKIIMDYHADYSNSASNWISLNILHKCIRRMFLYSVLKYIDKIYSIVPASTVFLNEVYGIPFNKIELLPLGVDTDKAKNTMVQNRGKVIRERLGILPTDFVIFTGGKLTPVKKTELVIEAFLQVADPRLHLIIVGTVDQEKSAPYKTLLNTKANGNKHVHFTGWLNGEEIYNYLDAADLAVFPASQSVLWQQAIGMGLPLVLGPLVEIGNKIWKQDTAYLNRNGSVIVLNENGVNAQEIAKNIKELTDNPILLNSMKQSALKTATEFLSYDKIVLQTLSFN